MGGDQWALVGVAVVVVAAVVAVVIVAVVVVAVVIVAVVVVVVVVVVASRIALVFDANPVLILSFNLSLSLSLGLPRLLYHCCSYFHLFFSPYFFFALVPFSLSSFFPLSFPPSLPPFRPPFLPLPLLLSFFFYSKLRTQPHPYQPEDNAEQEGHPPAPTVVKGV